MRETKRRFSNGVGSAGVVLAAVCIVSMPAVAQVGAPRGAQSGGIVTQEAPIHVSNVMVVGPDGKPTRIGYKFNDDGKKVRVARGGSQDGKEI